MMQTVQIVWTRGVVVPTDVDHELRTTDVDHELRIYLIYLIYRICAIVGQVMEGMETLEEINGQFCDNHGRPYRDIRILHTYVLDDPFDDPPQVRDYFTAAYFCTSEGTRTPLQ